jgi:peptide/nickel transport system substrate-binding protein
VDRKAMLANVFKTSGRLAYGPFPTGVELADTTLQAPPYDTTAAGKLLDEAGWKRGPDGVRVKNGKPLTLEILTPTTSAIRMRYGELLQEQLNRAGFRIEIGRVPAPEVGPRMGSRDYDMMIQALFTDPSVAGIQQWWSTASIPQGSNFMLYSNRVVDAALDSAGVAATPAEMHRLVARAFKQIIDDAPAVWLYSAGTTSAAHKRLEIPSLPRDGWWGDIPDWSIPKDKFIDRDRIGLRPAAAQ